MEGLAMEALSGEFHVKPCKKDPAPQEEEGEVTESTRESTRVHSQSASAGSDPGNVQRRGPGHCEDRQTSEHKDTTNQGGSDALALEEVQRKLQAHVKPLLQALKKKHPRVRKKARREQKQIHDKIFGEAYEEQPGAEPRAVQELKREVAYLQDCLGCLQEALSTQVALDWTPCWVEDFPVLTSLLMKNILPFFCQDILVRPLPDFLRFLANGDLPGAAGLLRDFAENCLDRRDRRVTGDAERDFGTSLRGLQDGGPDAPRGTGDLPEVLRLLQNNWPHAHTYVMEKIIERSVQSAIRDSLAAQQERARHRDRRAPGRARGRARATRAEPEADEDGGSTTATISAVLEDDEDDEVEEEEEEEGGSARAITFSPREAPRYDSQLSPLQRLPLDPPFIYPPSVYGYGPQAPHYETQPFLQQLPFAYPPSVYGHGYGQQAYFPQQLPPHLPFAYPPSGFGYGYGQQGFPYPPALTPMPGWAHGTWTEGAVP